MRRRTPAALIAALLLAGPAGHAGPAGLPGFAGSVTLRDPDPDFGGFSGIEVAPDGAAFLALSDRGAVLRGRIDRDATGRITGITASPPERLTLPAGPLPPDFRFDTEGLALAPDGTFFVSCEFVTRVLRYARPDAAPAVLPIPRDFAAMGQNTALEGLAIGPDGTLYTLPEQSQRPDRSYPVYRFRDGRWDVPFRIAGDGNFLPVGADIGPDGRLYILERQFRGLGGFASRVRRLDPDQTGLARDTRILETPPGMFPNLEGIAVWRDGAGALRLTMISDDNFLAVLGTEIVEFRVPG